jgi:hypothetical protein
MIIIKFLVTLCSTYLIGYTLFSAIETLVLPRSLPNRISWAVSSFTRVVFNILLKTQHTYPARDRLMAFYAPINLLLLPPTWLLLILIGYSGIYWMLGVHSWYEAIQLSGSSLLTLGYAPPVNWPQTIIEFSQAAIGLLLVALLISYLPTIYSAFSRRENAVTLLEVRAGNPPTALEMIARFHRIHGLDRLSEQWKTWESWFADIDESHTSLPILAFFRSPQPEHSWIIAAGAVLDAASLTLSALDIPYDASAALCIRGGYLALRHITQVFNIPTPTDPRFPDQPISVSRMEFDSVLNQLASQGVPIRSDSDQAWRDFAGWRVNYDHSLIALAKLTMAPQAPWTGDRTTDLFHPSPFFRRARPI